MTHQPTVLALLLGLSGASFAQVEMKIWRHETGDAEMKASAAAIERFNKKQTKYRAVVETLPQGSYQQAVTAAALAKKLPCVLDLDQPTVPNFAWAGHIQPLEGALLPANAASLISGAKTQYKSKLYALGQFDVVLTLFARKSVLEKNGIRIATQARPYTSAEFRDILVKLKAAGLAYPLDLNAQWGGEWASYAFSPWLQSAGADLIDRKAFKGANGVLNSDAALAVLKYYKGLFDSGLAERKPVDDQSFPAGRSAFHYTGSWSAPAYLEKFKDDLVAMPPPDFGKGPKVGAGSWQWAVSTSCPQPEGARMLLEHLMSADEIADFSKTTGLMPTSVAAADKTTLYKTGAFGRTFFEFSRSMAVTRPETAGYPMISSSFERALKDVREGGDPSDGLDRAVESIDQDIKRNRGYGF